MFKQKDIKYMEMAISLAKKGMGGTGVNPMVGAVIVKNEKVIGTGYHKGPGRPHAEVEALKGLSREKLKGAKLYLSLEPCCHANKLTPPCTNLLINKGVKSLIVAMRDPNKFVNGKGFQQLKKAGIEIKVGLLMQEAKQLNEIYIKSINRKRPFIILKQALSLDGKIATSTGSSRWVSNLQARKRVHKMRGFYDAVLTSSETVAADNPHLGVRLVKGRDPLRIVIDRKLKTGLDSKIYRDKNVLMITSEMAPSAKLKKLRAKGFKCLVYRVGIPLKKMMEDLYKMGIGSIMLECGGTLAAAFIKEKLIDKCIFFIAPVIVGADGISGIGNLGTKTISSAIKLKNMKMEQLDEDLMIEGYL